tara:strand:+ start:18880 stop:19317 length:438 start_codon:yes stop_codon:yes gene_type:complete
MRDLVSGRIDVKTPGNRSERYLYSSNTGGRGQILLRLWKERTPVLIGYCEQRHIRMLERGLKTLASVRDRLEVDFEEMLSGVLDLYFDEHLAGFPSPHMFFSLCEPLCREWYDSRFSPEIYLYDDDIISIDIDEFSSFNIELKSN